MGTSPARVREVESTDGRSRRASRELTRCMKAPADDALLWIALLAEIAEDFEAEGRAARSNRIRRRLMRDLTRLQRSSSADMLRVRLATTSKERSGALTALSEHPLEGRDAALRDGWRAALAWDRGDGCAGEPEAVKQMEMAFYALGAHVPHEDSALRHHEDLAWQADQISRWSAALSRGDDAVRWRRVALAFVTQAEQRPRLRAMQSHHEEALGRMLLAEERYAEASETLRAARHHASERDVARIDALLRDAEAKAEERRDARGLK